MLIVSILIGSCFRIFLWIRFCTLSMRSIILVSALTPSQNGAVPETSRKVSFCVVRIRRFLWSVTNLNAEKWLLLMLYAK